MHPLPPQKSPPNTLSWASSSQLSKLCWIAKATPSPRAIPIVGGFETTQQVCVCEVCQMKNGHIIQRFIEHWKCGPCFVWRTSDCFRTTNRALTPHGTFEPLQLNGLFYQTLTCRIIESDVFPINPLTNGNVSHSMSSRTTSCQPDALKRISISRRHPRNLENCQRLLLFFLIIFSLRCKATEMVPNFRLDVEDVLSASHLQVTPIFHKNASNEIFQEKLWLMESSHQSPTKLYEVKWNICDLYVWNAFCDFVYRSCENQLGSNNSESLQSFVGLFHLASCNQVLIRCWCGVGVHV